MTSLSRLALARYGTVALRRTVPRVQRRDLSSPALNASKNSTWVFAAYGFLGGACTTVGAAYAFYRWSGLKEIVDIVHPRIRSFKNNMLRTSQKSQSGNSASTNVIDAKRILAFFREAAKAQFAAIPGTGLLVDFIFNEVEKSLDAQEIDPRDILAVIGSKLGELQVIVSRVGQNNIGPLVKHSKGLAKHASDHMATAHNAAKPVVQEALEKGKGVISDLSRRLNHTAQSGAPVSPDAKVPPSISSPAEASDQP